MGKEKISRELKPLKIKSCLCMNDEYECELWMIKGQYILFLVGNIFNMESFLFQLIYTKKNNKVCLHWV